VRQSPPPSLSGGTCDGGGAETVRVVPGGGDSGAR
jgi:hypothetical protein